MNEEERLEIYRWLEGQPTLKGLLKFKTLGPFCFAWTEGVFDPLTPDLGHKGFSILIKPFGFTINVRVAPEAR